MDKKVLTQEELQKLKDFQNREEALVVSFGQLGYQRAILDEEEDILLESKKKFDKERAELASSLTTKYGNGSINIETGEITPVK